VRGSRLKNWRLYLLASSLLFLWLTLSLYQDRIDEFTVGALEPPQARSIYWCFRNVLEGLTLYVILLLLAYLSDFQHSGSSAWLCLVGAVVLAPLGVAVAILIVDHQVYSHCRIFRYCFPCPRRWM